MAQGNHEILESASPYRGGIISVEVDTIRLPNGRTTKREIVRHAAASAVVAVADARVLLVRQNRHAVGADLLEIPAGKLDEGEDPEACARRELQEETNYAASGLRPLGAFYVSPGFTDERVHLYLASGLTRLGPPPVDDDGEPITSEWLGLQQAVEAVTTGRIVDAKTALGLVLARLLLAPGETEPAS